MMSPQQHRVPLWPWFLFLLLLVIRLAWLNSYTPNSDEAQHAHVAWAWTQHLLPYRDVFDNHGPLFGWLHAPLLSLLDERADVLTWLRLAMQVWYVVALASIGWMGRRLYGWRVAVVAVVLAGLFPRFFMTSGQFRTDDMWMAMWLAGLAFVVGAPARAWRWFVAGLLVGCALSVSQKTLVLLVTSLLAWIAVTLMQPTSDRPFAWRCLGAGLVGLLLVPSIFTAWFAWHGVLGDAWYGLAEYNMGGVNKRHAAGNLLKFVLLTIALVVFLHYLVRRRGGVGFSWPAFLALQAGMYLFLIWFVWPLITGQDFLPAIPLIVLACCGKLARWKWLQAHDRWRVALIGAVVVIELATLVMMTQPWGDRLAGQRDELALVLRYTDKGDTVMDAKGDAIFRMRPYYPVIESLAMHRLRRGQMTDTIVDDLVSHRTMLVVLRRLPFASAHFVETNYVPAGGDVWVAGHMLTPSSAVQGVDVALPGDYVLTDGHGRLEASLDGAAAADHWFLSPGTHHFAVQGGKPVALVWQKAFDRGWRPLPPGAG